MLELVYRIVSKTIARTGLRVQVPSPVKFKSHRLGGIFILYGEAHQLLGARRDSRQAIKAVCLCAAWSFSLEGTLFYPWVVVPPRGKKRQL